MAKLPPIVFERRSIDWTFDDITFRIREMTVKQARKMAEYTLQLVGLSALQVGPEDPEFEAVNTNIESTNRDLLKMVLGSSGKSPSGAEVPVTDDLLNTLTPNALSQVLALHRTLNHEVLDEMGERMRQFVGQVTGTDMTTGEPYPAPTATPANPVTPATPPPAAPVA